MKLFIFIAAFISAITLQLDAGTVRLYNDSSYKLRAVIRGADGSYLGEVVITAQSSNTWTDSLQHYGHNDEGNPAGRNATRSQTPYTVIWYCMDGSDFSFSDNVGTGAFTQAQQGSGKKSCGGSKNPEIFKDFQGENILPPDDSTQGQ
jgi:hypothetical protein